MRVLLGDVLLFFLLGCRDRGNGDRDCEPVKLSGVPARGGSFLPRTEHRTPLRLSTPSAAGFYMNDPEGQCASRIAWTVDHERVASRGHDPVVDVCVTPRASFGFHMAQTLTPIGYFSSDYWSRYMMVYYPPEIREDHIQRRTHP